MDDLIDTGSVTSNLAHTVFKLIERNKALQKEVEFLKQRLEISRKLQEKPKLYPPPDDPYFGEDDAH